MTCRVVTACWAPAAGQAASVAARRSDCYAVLFWGVCHHSSIFGYCWVLLSMPARALAAAVASRSAVCYGTHMSSVSLCAPVVCSRYGIVSVPNCPRDQLCIVVMWYESRRLASCYVAERCECCHKRCDLLLPAARAHAGCAGLCVAVI